MGAVRTAGKVVQQSLAVGYRAAENGHPVTVERMGKRFRLVCPCGFATPVTATRKTAYELATRHAIDAARGDIPAIPDAD